MIMKHYFPKYCEEFRCIANLCSDSCCKDWDVVVDDTSFDFYNTAKGEFGDRLRSLMTIDEDGDRIFIRQGEKCPFWNSDMLCDIYINLGENRLCHTCKEFPRITQDYTAFCEHTLSFACPEAARLMLNSDFDTNFATDIPPDSSTDYSTTEMNFLLSARKHTLEILSDSKMPLSERLCRLLAFNDRVQNMFDDEIFDISAMPTDEYEKKNCGDVSFIFDLHKNLDIMSKNWLCELNTTAEFTQDHTLSNGFDKQLTAYLDYYVRRYYLSAIDNLNVISTIKRMVCAYIVTAYELERLENPTQTEIVKILQRYSKEVEHSYENGELLEDEFIFNPLFLTDNLISIL